jgi:hypothetical protein
MSMCRYCGKYSKCSFEACVPMSVLNCPDFRKQKGAKNPDVKLSGAIAKKVGAIKPKKRKKTKKVVSERAVYGRLKKILLKLPMDIKGLGVVRTAYKSKHGEELKMSRALQAKVLQRYRGEYENLVRLEAKKKARKKAKKKV